MRNSCQIVCEHIDLLIAGSDEFAEILRTIRDKRRRLRGPKVDLSRRHTDLEHLAENDSVMDREMESSHANDY